MKNNTPFFAIVGPVREDKVALFKALQSVPTLAHFTFLSESQCAGETHNKHHSVVNHFVNSTTKLAREGVHEYATPHSQLLFFWSRLTTVIKKEIAPCLACGTPVIIKGFGGSVLANALANTTSLVERTSLVTLHKSIVNECVIGSDVHPPKYLFLRTDPAMAQKRHRINEMEVLEHIAMLNHHLGVYGSFPGQTVIEINADQRPSLVLKDALSHIMPQHDTELVVS